ncbi:hypothetical protein [Pseudochryseolinea flava]|uniref:hypothetical protein n=1 Tax=Pseudochryseolinea flava TaxID=2059302 RepID=UPI0010581DAA|nr:hypothetical protein [Pseudochryseolinea flava]
MAYTLISPVLRNLINILHAVVDKHGDKRVLKISEDTHVPFNRFIQLKNESTALRRELNDVFDREKSLQNEKQLLVEEIKSLKDDFHSVQVANNELLTFQKEVNRNEIISGNWVITSDDQQYNVHIINNQVHFLDKYARNRLDQLSITHFFFDSRYKRMWFLMLPSNQEEKNSSNDKSLSEFSGLFCDLKFQGPNMLVGMVNNRQSTQWVKVVG